LGQTGSQTSQLTQSSVIRSDIVEGALAGAAWFRRE
jgi:hypothetical protein